MSNSKKFRKKHFLKLLEQKRIFFEFSEPFPVFLSELSTLKNTYRLKNTLTKSIPHCNLSFSTDSLFKKKFIMFMVFATFF